MFRIGEFSKLTQVSIRMLRYYDEVGLLKPADIDNFTNYRLYSAEQISELNKIKFLRDLGFNVSEIAGLLSQQNDECIVSELENKRLEIENTIKVEQDKLSKIKLARRDFQKEQISMNYNVSIKCIPSFQVLSLRRTVHDYYVEGELWKELSEYVNLHHISILNHAFTIYHDNVHREKEVDMEICVLVDKMGENSNGFLYRNTEHIPIMACTMVYGKFDNIAGAYLALANWLQEHNQYEMTGQSRQVVHRGPWNEGEPAKYLTEIQIPLGIRKKI